MNMQEPPRFTTIEDLPSIIRNNYSENCQRDFLIAYNWWFVNGNDHKSSLRIAIRAANACAKTDGANPL